MTLPGTSVTVGDGGARRSAAASSGTAFFIGLTDRGSVTDPILVRSMREATLKLGGHVDYGQIYDALDVFFREGGSTAYIGRIVGPAAINATEDLVASATPTLTVTAISPGAWGNDLEVDVVAGDIPGDFRIEISENGNLVERSPSLADNTAAVQWATGSSYIRLTDLAEGDPDVQSVSLTTGTDDRASITGTQVAAALARFKDDLGPGQVAYPGATDASSQKAVVVHAQSNNRIALLDGVNTATVGTLTAQAATLTAEGNGRSGALFAPWAEVPGRVPGTTRTVPWSAVQAGLSARSDGATNNPNVAVAGENAACRYVTGLSQAGWTDSERETLNDSGVNVVREKFGTIRTYGNRTLANQVTEANWTQLSNARLAMFIASQANELAEHYLFAQIDGRGIKLSEFAGDLQGILLPLYQIGALYGESPEDAFAVETGEGVNSAESLAEGRLAAVISVRMSPAAERVEITISKIAATEEI